MVLLCGVADSGKTTFAQQLETEGYARLSAATEDILRQRPVSLIRQGCEGLLDFSFWQRATTDRCKRLVEATCRTWRLLHLKVDPAVLRQRLHDRAKRFDANASFPIA